MNHLELEAKDVANKLDCLIGYLQYMQNKTAPWHVPPELPAVLAEAEALVCKMRKDAIC